MDEFMTAWLAEIMYGWMGGFVAGCLVECG
jgi:hypothetical protein